MLLCFADLVMSIALIAPDIMVMFRNAALFVLSVPFRKLCTRFSAFIQAVVCFPCAIRDVGGDGLSAWRRLGQVSHVCFVFPDLFP